MTQPHWLRNVRPKAPKIRLALAPGEGMQARKLQDRIWSKLKG